MQIQALPAAIKKRSEQLEMPVLYVQACKALEACATMDEAKYYSDKSDALAAWAKIYGSDEDSRAAARLKLRAYARMGKLSEELAPKRGTYRSGMQPGPQALLISHGLSKANARSARALGKLDEATFERIVTESPRAPCTVVQQDLRKAAPRNEGWKKLWYNPASPHLCLAYLKSLDLDVVRELAIDEAAKIRAVIVDLIERLDELERHLPK